MWDNIHPQGHYLINEARGEMKAFLFSSLSSYPCGTLVFGGVAMGMVLVLVTQAA